MGPLQLAEWSCRGGPRFAQFSRGVLQGMSRLEGFNFGRLRKNGEGAPLTPLNSRKDDQYQYINFARNKTKHPGRSVSKPATKNI